MVDTAVEFEAHRARLFGIAYRMLGSASEAEDLVQEAYLRWERADRHAVAAPGAWLAKVVTNLSLNELASARMRREQYVGPWLPEPVLTSANGAVGAVAGAGGAGARTASPPLGPLETVEQRDSVSFALLVLLERLTAPERAVFVLREAFDYPHREIAELLETSEANSRQLHRRARKAIGRDTPAARTGATGTTEADGTTGATAAVGGTGVGAPVRQRWTGLVETFVAAAREGDLRRLERLLTEDVVSYADGGGRISTARRPILGRAKVARYLAGGLARFAAAAVLVPCEVNGGPALLALAEGGLLGVVTLEVAEERIAALRICVSPDKIAFAARQFAAYSPS
ncbi:sigma-70 family RNA polymerase sigma factor [Streptomyces sp. NPDC006992]|uniref:sigma-70 family RNA polymerase sigma factor n=1 Tax=Streptomyces sp. NPDC006992 TaxID=3155601 RepID=UPI0033D8DE96